MKTTFASVALAIVFCGLAVAQGPPAAQPSPPRDQGYTVDVGPPMEGHVFRGSRGPFVRVVGPPKWWKNSALMKQIGVSDDQITRIEKIFQDHRLQLIDLHAALEKQEAILDPLVDADQPDQTEVVAQIDKVAQARAALEKSDALMLLAIRRVLTVDQWKKIRENPGFNTFHLGPETRTPMPGPVAPTPPAMPPPRE